MEITLLTFFVNIQIENEYGSYFACDYSYGRSLRDKVRSILGNEVVIYTTDGCGLKYVSCGKVNDVYASVDFGPNRKKNPTILIYH